MKPYQRSFCTDTHRQQDTQTNTNTPYKLKYKTHPETLLFLYPLSPYCPSCASSSSDTQSTLPHTPVSRSFPGERAPAPASAAAAASFSPSPVINLVRFSCSGFI
jgi:hypothetical protein